MKAKMRACITTAGLGENKNKYEGTRTCNQAP